MWLQDTISCEVNEGIMINHTTLHIPYPMDHGLNPQNNKLYYHVVLFTRTLAYILYKHLWHCKVTKPL
jgi:hypothetical protein